MRLKGAVISNMDVRMGNMKLSCVTTDLSPVTLSIGVLIERMGIIIMQTSLDGGEG